MKRILFVNFMIVLFFGCQEKSSLSEQDDKTADVPSLAFATDNAGLTLPKGFQAVLVTDTIGRARHIAVNDNGDIYINLRRLTDKGGLVALRDNDGDGIADEKEYFGNLKGTGMEIYNGYLYFSSDTSVHRYKLNPDQLVPDGEPEAIVTGFIYQTQHAAKPFTFDKAGKMYVNVGAPSNACQEEDRQKESSGMDPCPLLERQGGIWQFDAERRGQTQVDDGLRYATGLRHCVAISWNPVSDHLYVVQHGRDMMHNWWPETYTEEVPAEEFFLVNNGSDFGWPYCFYDQLKGKKVLNPEFGGDGEKQGRCAEKEGPIMAFPGHYAPNDLLFYTGDQFPDKYRHGAFIAFHGSWNREADHRQQGYHVVFVPFDGDNPSGDWEVFADGFEGPENVASPGDALHRPTGLAVGPDGSLYITDSVKGAVYRIVYTGKSA